MTTLPSRLVLLGHPVGHSVSPLFQNAALRQAGLSQEYVTLDVPPGDLSRVMHELSHANAGGNVTIPHKRAVFDLCDVVTPVAKRVHAVNTFWVEHGTLHGDNTDVIGFDRAVRAVIDPSREGLRVAVIGAGGAAGAVLAATEAWPKAQVVVCNRTKSHAEEIAQSFDHARVETSLPQAVAHADLVVNATSLGLRDNAMPVDPALLPPGAAVFDLVYAPNETAWVRACRAAGHLAADGLGMLVEQGAAAFTRWFGVTPDRDAMWAALAQHGITRAHQPTAS